MLRKTTSVFIGIFIIQTLGSCLYRCNDIKTYSVNYESFEILTFDSSGSSLTNSDSALQKKAFEVRVIFQTEEMEVIDYRITTQFGFSSAKAIQKCEGDNFVYEDLISDIRITGISDEGDEILLTDDFLAKDYNNKFISIEKMVEQENEATQLGYYRFDSFWLKLRNYKNLPQKFKLRIEINLESGILLTKETATLYFVD